MNKPIIHPLISLSVLTLILLAACAGQAQIPVNPQPVNPTTSATANAAANAAVPTATVQAAIPVTSTGEAQVPASAGCSSPANLTPAMTEGPYFKAGSPETANLAQNMPGIHLTLSGYVLTVDCKPVDHALLDFWQADSQGQYDNSGYTLRGHVYTDASGRYQIVTIVPGLYPGRTEHIHVKVQATNGPILTTQLFFPGVAQNESDSIFDQRLLLAIQRQGNGLEGEYNFIIATK